MNIKFLFIILNFYLVSNISTEVLDVYCQKFSHKFSIFENSLSIKNLENFCEIKWLCIDQFLTDKIGFINFYFIQRLETDYQFDLNKVNLMLKSRIQINFFYVELLSSRKPIFIKLISYSKYIAVNFFHSKLLALNNCRPSYSKNIGIFQSVHSVVFAFTVKYFSNTCPLIFQNSNLFKLVFHGLSKSFLKVNLIGFNQSIDTNYLNNTIDRLELNFFKGPMKKKNMIFKNVSKLELNGLIDLIEDDSLESLFDLKFIKMDMSSNMITNGFKWTNVLNKNIFVNLSNQTLVKQNQDKIVYLFLNFDLVSNKEQYLYPDEDFCFFKDIPDYRLVFVLPFKNQFSGKIKNCSCLLFWLFKHKHFLWKPFPLYSNLFIPNCELESKNNSFMEKCNFFELIKKCEEKKNIFKENFYSNIIFSFKIFDLFLFLFTTFWISIAILTTILNFLILIKTKRSIEKKISTDSLMFANLIINFLFILLLILYLSKKCISPNSYICSPIYNTIFAQIIDIYVFKYFGNILKFLSYLFQLMVSVKRLSLLSSEFKEKIKILFEKKILKIFILIFCIFYPINELVPLILMSKINNLEPIYDEIINYVEYPNNGLFFLTYSVNVKPIFNYREFNYPYLFYILNFVINHLFGICLFLFIEFKLFINFRSAIFKKDKLRSKNSTSNNFNLNRSLNTIIINMAIISFLRFFETIVFGLIVYQKSTGRDSKFNICFRYSKICTVMAEINDFLFLITIVSNSISYYLIEKKFRDCLKKYFKICFY